MFGDLCEELMVEIFTRLPTKSLLRFRSVSKWLYGCIGSPSFVQLHTLRSPNKAMIIHYIRMEEEMREDNMYTLHSKDQLSSSPYSGITVVQYPFYDYGIVASCNGILCVNKNANTLHLWNPSIRRKVTIQCPPSRTDGLHQRIIGFGFDPTIDDYKIVKLIRSNAEEGVERKNSYVYTIKTGIWREIACPATEYTCLQSTQCLYKESLYWVVKREVSGPHDYYDYVLTFNLRSEVFSKIELPEQGWETNEVRVINNCLSVISSNYKDCSIWVRRESNNSATSWSIAFILDINGLVGMPPIYVRQLNANDVLLLHAYLSGIVVYNPETQVYSRVENLRDDCYTVGMFMCVESLELLDMGSSCDQRSSGENEVMQI